MKMKMKLKSFKSAPRKKGTNALLPAEEISDDAALLFEEQIEQNMLTKYKNKYKVEVLNYDIKNNQIKIDAGEEQVDLFTKFDGCEAILKLPNRKFNGFKGVLYDNTKTIKLDNSLYNKNDKELIEEYIDNQIRLQDEKGAKSYLKMKVFESAIEAENEKIVLSERDNDMIAVVILE